jgi:hypothetical protein
MFNGGCERAPVLGLGRGRWAGGEVRERVLDPFEVPFDLLGRVDVRASHSDDDDGEGQEQRDYCVAGGTPSAGPHVGRGPGLLGSVGRARRIAGCIAEASAVAVLSHEAVLVSTARARHSSVE